MNEKPTIEKLVKILEKIDAGITRSWKFHFAETVGVKMKIIKWLILKKSLTGEFSKKL